MTRKSIGDIDIEDYLRMTLGQRARAPRKTRVLKALGFGFAAMLFMAAGNYIRPWTGKDTLTVPFSQGIEALEVAHSEPDTRAAIGVAYRGAERVINLLRERAEDPGKVGLYSRVALANAARQSVDAMLELARDDTQANGVRSDIERLYQTIKKECPWLQ